MIGASSYTVTIGADQPAAIHRGDAPITLRPKERSVIVALALSHPNALDADRLISIMWPDGRPASARQSFHNHLARLRATAPGLIVSHRGRYSLDETIELAVHDWPGADRPIPRLPDLADSPAHDGMIREFRRRWSSSAQADLRQRMRNEPPEQLVAELEAHVAEHPFDERGWWELMVGLGASGRDDEVRTALIRATAILNDIGLDPARRLLDVDRLVRDGVTDVERLAADPYGDAGLRNRRTADLRSHEREVVRNLLKSDEPFVLQVVGEESPARADLVAQIVHEARIRRFDAVVTRHSDQLPLPPEPRLVWNRSGPALIGVDEAEHAADVPAMIEQLRRDRDPGKGATGHTSVVVTALPGDPELEGATRLLVPGADSDEPPVEIDQLPTGTLELASLLSLLDEPVSTDELHGVMPDAVAALQPGLRARLLRFDMRTSRVDLVSRAVRERVVRRLDEDVRRELARRLMSLELSDESERHRLARRMRLAIIGFGATSDEATELARSAIDSCRTAGDLGAAAVVSRYMMDAIEVDAGRTTEWCEFAIRAGRHELATGRPDGDATLLDAIDVAQRIEAHSLLSRSVLELCRLGRTTTAGRSDPRSAALISSLLESVTAPPDRARLGAAAAMVFSFTGEPERLRSIYNNAERDARATGDDALLIEVLPLAYMSLPLPSDADRRTTTAAELLELGERHARPEATWEGRHLQLATEVMTVTGDPRATYRLLVEASAHLHERSREWEMHYVRSNIALLDGDLEQARQQIDGSLQFIGDVNESRVSAVFGAHHLAIALVDDSVADFVDVIRQLVHDQPEISAWRAALALSCARAGIVGEARSAFETSLEGGPERWPRDHTYAPALVCLGEAAVALDDRSFQEAALERIDSLAGTWSWCGSCTFGPIDLTIARLQLALGERHAAARSATSAIRSAARLRAPRYVEAATSVLLSTS